MKKRILSMLLVIVMVLSMVPVSALAEGTGAGTGSGCRRWRTQPRGTRLSRHTSGTRRERRP